MSIMYRVSYKKRHIQQIEVRFQGIRTCRPEIEFRYTNPMDYKKYQLKRCPDGWLSGFTDDNILYFNTLDEAKKSYLEMVNRDLFLKQHELNELTQLKESIEMLTFKESK